MKFSRVFVHSSAMLAVAVTGLIGCSGETGPEVYKEFVYTEAEFPSCHAATIVEAADGELVTAFFGGTHEGADDVCIYLSHKKISDCALTAQQDAADGPASAASAGAAGCSSSSAPVNTDSKSVRTAPAGAAGCSSFSAPADAADASHWTAPVKVAEDSLGPCWNPVLFKAADSRLLLFYKTSKKIPEWVGHIKTSYDNGRTWGEDTVLPKGLLGAIKNKPVMLESGRIISPSSDESDGWKVHFELSDDDGKTWRKVGPIPAEDSLFVIQPTIIKHKSGSLGDSGHTRDGALGDSGHTKSGALEALCRTMNGRLASTVSTDDGESWSKVELLDLPQNNSGLDAVTLPDGRFVMVCNPVGNSPGKRGGPRTPLCVLISKDGHNWENIATLEDDNADNGYSYPSVIYGSDGCLHIVYTWRRERIAYARIKLK